MNIYLNKIVFPLIKQNLFTLSRVNPGKDAHNKLG